MTTLSSTKQPASGFTLWFPRIVTGIVLVWCLGWLFHTCPYPVLFGKYNERYIAFLSALFLFVPALAYFTSRFLVSTSELQGSRGKKYYIRPIHKWTAVLFVMMTAYISVGWLVSWLMGGGVSTRAVHDFHPYLQNVPKPLHAEQHVNRWGFKGDDIELVKPQGVYRVFVFGGSTVHCGTVPFEQTHVRLLEKKLQSHYPDKKIEVQNLGAEWHCSEHDVIKLMFDAQEFSPDLVIVFHGINDLIRALESDVFSDGPYRHDYRHYFGAVANLARPGKNTWTMINTAGGHWMSDFRFQQVRLHGPEGMGLNGSLTLFFPKTQPMDISHWNSLPAFERNMRRFVQVAQEQQYDVLLATQPSLYHKDLSATDQEVLVFPRSHQGKGRHVSLESMTDGMRQFNEVTKKIAADRDVRLVDLDAAMPKTTEYLYDDCHYTARGNALIGEHLAEAVIRADFIPRRMSGTKSGDAQPSLPEQ
jgi:lysophospholipase L1-like esterase